MDLSKAQSWIDGQIRLDNGTLVKFRFSPDEEHGGGKINLIRPQGKKVNQITTQELSAVSTALALDIKDLLEKGKVLFTPIEPHITTTGRGRQ